MASQCQCLSLQSSTSRLFSTTLYDSSTSCDFKVDQASVFLRNQRLQPHRLPRRLSNSTPSRPRPLLQCVSSSAFNTTQPFSNNGDKDKRQQSSSSTLMSTLISKAPEPIRVFPWGTAGSLFVQRVLHQCWSVGKWLAMPVLAVSMLSELSYTFLQEQVLIVPAGMLGGVAFAGMMKDTAVELSSGLEVGGQIPWHLVLLGSFFGALKFIGPYLPTWGRVSVPHFANGGLWHVIKLVIDWRKQHADRTVKRS